jgi:hypothetical protein
LLAALYKRKMKLLNFVVLATLLAIVGCNDNSSTHSGSKINPGNDPNFIIVANSNDEFELFNRKVDVFGIPIYAVAAVDDQRLLHAANIMAQYLDNNEDGVIDNPLVIDAMLAANAFMVMWKDESDLNDISPPDNAKGQDLGNDETIPDWHKNGQTGQFDASLEEVWHIITHAGYANAYPSVFGENPGSVIANAMDIARGGQFMEIPDSYPSTAWYTYDDKTCNYFYWAMTSILAAQENRLDEIGQEWKLNTKKLVENTDVAIYKLLTDSQYKLPTTLPDGTYRR